MKNGSGAIGGSVNLFTDPDWHKGVRGKVLGEYGSYGTYTAGAQVSTGGEKQISKLVCITNTLTIITLT